MSHSRFPSGSGKIPVHYFAVRSALVRGFFSAKFPRTGTWFIGPNAKYRGGPWNTKPDLLFGPDLFYGPNPKLTKTLVLLKCRNQPKTEGVGKKNKSLPKKREFSKIRKTWNYIIFGFSPLASFCKLTNKLRKQETQKVNKFQITLLKSFCVLNRSFKKNIVEL